MDLTGATHPRGLTGDTSTTECDRPDVEARTEAGSGADCGATGSRARGSTNVEAMAVWSTFGDEWLVAQHELADDALGDATTAGLHSLGVPAYTPEEAGEREWPTGRANRLSFQTET